LQKVRCGGIFYFIAPNGLAMISADQKTRNFINLNTLKMKKENPGLPQNEALNIGVVMPRFSKKNVIDAMLKRQADAFSNGCQNYEMRELGKAIDIIERLVPPSCFPNGA
jgi:hypothetical protein